MDAMALLCNVHADGPATRSLLSRAGCDSLRDLLAIPPEELARILGSTPSFARRMLLEAKELAERESSLLERDEEGATIRPATPPVSAGARPLPAPAAPPMSPSSPSTWAVTDSLRPGLLAGLDATWCERLASRGVSTLDALAGAPGLELSRETGLPYPRLAELQCLARGMLTRPPAARREPGAAPTGAEPLRPGLFEGLDEARCRQMAACGVTTLETLADAPGLELARRLGLSYPRLLDLQHLARRHLASTLTPMAARPSPIGAPARWEPSRALPSPTTNAPGVQREPTRWASSFVSREAEALADPGSSGPFC